MVSPSRVRRLIPALMARSVRPRGCVESSSKWALKGAERDEIATVENDFMTVVTALIASGRVNVGANASRGFASGLLAYSHQMNGLTRGWKSQPG